MTEPASHEAVRRSAASSEEDDDPGESIASSAPPARTASSSDAETDAPASSGLSIVLSLETPDADPPAAGWVEPRVAEAARRLGVRGGELSLAVLSDEDMAAAHLHHLGEAGPTDTLSFDLCDAGSSPAAVEGEVLLGMGVAQREAQRHGHAVRLELLLYALHGLLHLMGEDDRSDAAFRAMHEKENALLEALGLPPIAETDPSR